MTHRLPQRVIIFCLPGIGDAILFTPALTLLRRALPQARITVLTMFRGTADVLETNPDLDEVRHFDFFNASRLEGLRYVLGLRREGFDLSIMPYPSNRLEYNLVNRLVGRRWRAGHRYRHQSLRNLCLINNIVISEAGDLHNVEENLCLIQAICDRLGVARPGLDDKPKLKLVVRPDEESYATTFLTERRIDDAAMLFGLHTYSSTFKNMHRKCWNKDNFVTLIHRLSQSYPTARFLLFSGPSDEETNQYIIKNSNADGRVVLVREANLRRAAALLKRCRVFISNDSGLMHLAGAADVPVVGLFGPTNWRQLYPWTERRVVVRRDLPCMPCFYYSSRPLRCLANINYACMREISVDEVFDAVQNLLAPTNAKTITAKR